MLDNSDSEEDESLKGGDDWGEEDAMITQISMNARIEVMRQKK